MSNLKNFHKTMIWKGKNYLMKFSYLKIKYTLSKDKIKNNSQI